MKTVLLLGATGTLGKAVTERFLTLDHYKTIQLTRHAKADGITGMGTLLIDGNASNSDDIKDSISKSDVVICMISGEMLPQVAQAIVKAMDACGKKRLIFMGAVGIYNEIPDAMDGKDNLANEPAQIPNRKAADLIEASDLDYTILRPGFLRDGKEDDFTLSFKGEAAKGYITTISSLVKLIVRLADDESLYNHQSVSITKDMRQA